jgi:hypothetical protein
VVLCNGPGYAAKLKFNGSPRQAGRNAKSLFGHRRDEGNFDTFCDQPLKHRSKAVRDCFCRSFVLQTIVYPAIEALLPLQQALAYPSKAPNERSMQQRPNGSARAIE